MRGGGRVAVAPGRTVPRFIPACAGRTVSGGLNVSRVRVHPRMRGADAVRGPRVEPRGGSSPHARGGRGVSRAGAAFEGFIPARAGRTFSAIIRRGRSTVHPRTRGADTS